MKDRPPQELMRLVQQGGDEGQEAFCELMRRFKDPITAFAMRLLNDTEKANDVAQETFINIFTHAGGYRPLASFNGWLYRIAYNLAITEIRRQRRQPAFSYDAAASDDDAGAPRFEPRDARAGAEEKMLERERHALVRRCVASLPARYRAAVVMKDMEGLTFDEIATILRCPESTVKSRVMRGRMMIRQRLGL